MVVFVATMVLPQYSVVLAVLLPERSVAVAVVELEVLVDCCCELRVLRVLLLLLLLVLWFKNGSVSLNTFLVP